MKILWWVGLFTPLTINTDHIQIDKFYTVHLILEWVHLKNWIVVHGRLKSALEDFHCKIQTLSAIYPNFPSHYYVSKVIAWMSWWIMKKIKKWAEMIPVYGRPQLIWWAWSRFHLCRIWFTFFHEVFSKYFFLFKAPACYSLLCPPARDYTL